MLSVCVAWGAKGALAPLLRPLHPPDARFWLPKPVDSAEPMYLMWVLCQGRGIRCQPIPLSQRCDTPRERCLSLSLSVSSVRCHACAAARNVANTVPTRSSPRDARTSSPGARWLYILVSTTVLLVQMCRPHAFAADLARLVGPSSVVVCRVGSAAHAARGAARALGLSKTA